MLFASRGAAAALASLCLVASAQARPYGIDDLLRQETFGAEAIDPSGRWMVFEQRDPYDHGTRYDWYTHTSEALTRLKVVDLKGPARVRALLKVDPGPGVTLGDFSPSGARLAVYRLRGASMALGVVTMASGRVTWLHVTPERPDWGRGLQWLSDSKLLVLDRPDGEPSWSYREGRASAQEAPARWAASARGAVGRTVVGSGAYAAIRPRPAPRALVEIDLARGAERRLAGGEFRDLEISPDRSRVELLEAGADIQPRANGPVQGIEGISDQALSVSILDLRSGVRRLPCPGWDAAPHLLSWSPSGAGLLVFARPEGALWSQGRVLEIDAADGRSRPVAGDLRPVLDLRPEMAHAAWMGEDVVVLARPADSAEGRPDWFRLSPGGPINLTKDLPSAPRRLQAIDAAQFTTLAGDAVWRVSRSGVATRLATGAAHPVEAPRTSAGTQRLDLVAGAGAWITTDSLSGPELQWLDAAGPHEILRLPPGAETGLIASRRFGAALVTGANAQGVKTMSLVRQGQATPLAQINLALDEVPPPVVRTVRHQGPDGQMLTSWLFLPPQPGPSPPPLVVQAYAGAVYPTAPRDYPGERGFLTHIQMLVGHGYAVLVASLPLTPRHPDPMAGLGGRLCEIVDAVAADPDLRRRIDLDRVALWGHSYGGYTVMAAIAQTDRFRAAVALSGLSDLISKWEAMPAAYRAAPEEGLHNNWSSGSVESGQDNMGAPPWVDLQRYIRNSPFFFADSIKTPLLLIHGDQDVIPLPQSEAMFSALYRQDKDAILVTYWGEGHLIVSPGNVRDLYRQAFAFLDKNFERPATPSDAAQPKNPEAAPASSAPMPPR